MYANLNPRTMGMNKYSFEEVLGAAHRNGFQGIEVPAHAFGSVEAAREQGKVTKNLKPHWNSGQDGWNGRKRQDATRHITICGREVTRKNMMRILNGIISG